MQGIVHLLNYLEPITLQLVGSPFQPPYKGRGAVLVLLGLWGLMGSWMRLPK